MSVPKISLRGKLCLVTGAAGGLGKEFSRLLLTAGCRVCLTDINSDLGAKTLAEFASIFGSQTVHFVSCDVTSASDVDRAWDEACKRFSADQVDILVNNAGVMGEKEGWRLCLEINLTGLLNGSNLAMAKMGRSSGGGRGGVIVNIASILGLFNAKQPKGWAYNTSKSAVVTFSRCVGTRELEAREGIRVVCLCPSVTQTPILKGCTEDELEEMRKSVGGFMDPEQVGGAFVELLRNGPTGSVMAVWKDCPPYYVPDAGMGIFVASTAVAMAMRFFPRVTVVTGRHMAIVALVNVVLFMAMAYLTKMLFF